MTARVFYPVTCALCLQATRASCFHHDDGQFPHFVPHTIGRTARAARTFRSCLISRRIISCALLLFTHPRPPLPVFPLVGDDKLLGYRSAAVMTPIISLFMIPMLLARGRALRGQHEAIAVCRLLGDVGGLCPLTLPQSNGIYTAFRDSVFLWVMVGMAIALDLAYLVLLLSVKFQWFGNVIGGNVSANGIYPQKSPAKRE